MNTLNWENKIWAIDGEVFHEITHKDNQAYANGQAVTLQRHEGKLMCFYSEAVEQNPINELVEYLTFYNEVSQTVGNDDSIADIVYEVKWRYPITY